MESERFEVQRTIASDSATIFRLLSDPPGHVAIDSSGMLTAVFVPAWLTAAVTQ